MTQDPQFHDEVVFQSALVRIAAFRCDADHSAFRQSAPVEDHCIWFSRTPVVIQPQRERWFVANANTAVFYNRGELFSRRRVATQGDESDWFAVEESVACRIVDAHASYRRAGSTGPFPWSHVAVDSATYLRQRMLFEAAASASPADAFAIEEAVVDLVERTIVQASSKGRKRHQVSDVSSRHRRLVRNVELVLSGQFARPLSLRDLAGGVGASVYHLCRVFREVTGSTMHQYRRRLRLRAALEAVTCGDESLIQIAARLGFPSHSHFTRAFYLDFGVLPSVLRRFSRTRRGRPGAARPAGANHGVRPTSVPPPGGLAGGSSDGARGPIGTDPRFQG
jgi:AraC family transcriptional regulator